MATSVDSFKDLEELGCADDSLTDLFNTAANHLQTLLPNVDNQTLLTLYGYYKQGLQGACKVPKPSWYDMKAKSKWEAWSKLGDMPRNAAKQIYIDTIKKLDPSFNNSKDSWVAVSTLQNNGNSEQSENKTIFDYVKEADHSQVKNILEGYSGKDVVNKIDDNGMGLIHWASDRGSVDVLKLLIEFGADVNLQDSDGQTALHYASSCGHVECVKLLLGNHAKVGVLDNDELSPAAVASDEAVKELLVNFR